MLNLLNERGQSRPQASLIKKNIFISVLVLNYVSYNTKLLV